MQAHEQFGPGKRAWSLPDQREALVFAAHALALFVFFYEPLAGAALLMLVVALTVGLSNSIFIASACVGLLWVNDVIADFLPYTQATAWKDVLLLLLIMGWLFRAAIHRLPLVRKSDISIPLLLFVALYAVMCLQSDSVSGAILGMKAVVFYMFWFVVLPDVVKTKDDLRVLIGALIFGTICIALYNLWRVQQPLGTFPPTRTGRMFNGILQTHHSSSGLLIPAGLFLMVTLAPLSKGWKKLALWLAVAVVVGGFLATTLRSGWGTTIVGLLMIGWLGRRVPQVIGALLVAVLAAGLLQASLQVKVTERALSTFDTQDTSRNAREAETYERMYPFVLQHPFGLGTGSMSAVSSFKVWGGGKNIPFAIQGGLIHNNLLMIAIETGWIGPILFVWFLLSALILAVRNYRTARDPYLKAVSLALCGFVAFYMAMQVLGPVLLMPSISFIAFVMFAMLVIVPDLDVASPKPALERETVPV